MELSQHALRQAQLRGFDPDLTLRKIKSIQAKLDSIGHGHVYVICYKFNKMLYRHKCEGDRLVACVDLDTRKVVTIMLQRQAQVKMHQKTKTYVEA